MVWARTHQEALAVAGILIILLAIGVPYYLHLQEQKEKDAATFLNMGQYYLHAQVDPQRGPFKSELERNQEALKTFLRVTTDYAGAPSAKIARYYVAKCQFISGQYPLAYVSFDLASQELKSTPLEDEAALGKILCLEVQGQWTQAISLYEAFLTEKPNSFLAPEFRLHLAESYLKAGNKSKALEEFKTTSEKYPDTSWGKQAAWRLSDLNSNS